MTVTDEQLTKALRDCFAEHEALVGSIAPHRVLESARPASPKGRRRVGMPLLAAAAVAAVSLGIWAVAANRLPVGDTGATRAPGSSSISTSRPPTGLGSPSATGDPIGDARNQAAAAAYVERVLQSVGLPDGFVLVDGPPAPALEQPDVLAVGNLTHETRFYTGPGTVAGVLDGVRAPDGFVRSKPAGPDPFSQLWFADGSPDPAAHRGAEVLVAAATIGPDRVGLRLDVTAQWRPARVPELTVDPDTVTRAVVTTSRLPPTTNGEVSNRAPALTGAPLREILVAVNRQPGHIDAVHPCPWTPEKDELLLDTTGGAVVIEIPYQCGGLIRLYRNGIALAPALDGAFEVRELIDAALAKGAPTTGLT